VRLAVIRDAGEPRLIEESKGTPAGGDRRTFAATVEMGGSISGEHGLGRAKSGYLRHRWDERMLALHRDLKRVFDPDSLLNPEAKQL
jgi:hypothetical protein